MNLDDVPEQPRTWVVYRAFDAQGQLLYVGLTWRLRGRMQEHASGRSNPDRRPSPWWDLATRVTIEVYTAEGDAWRAEREAIRTERPRFNRPPGGKPERARAAGQRGGNLDSKSGLLRRIIRQYAQAMR